MGVQDLNINWIIFQEVHILYFSFTEYTSITVPSYILQSYSWRNDPFQFDKMMIPFAISFYVQMEEII